MNRGLGFNLIFAALTLTFLASCTSTYCRQSYRNKRGKLRDTSEKAIVKKPDNTIEVYKYDGSLQCNLGQAQSPKEMAKQLSGIEILAQKKKNDGLNHITVCGSVTGDANVYRIHAKDLNFAKKKNFKVWEY